jgi:hypothetical protein
LFGSPANSRFAFGDREAAALRADLDFAGLTERRSAMRFEGDSWLRPKEPTFAALVCQTAKPIREDANYL